MDLTRIFCDIDDFCQEFEVNDLQQQITEGKKQRNRQGNLCLSEIMTILVLFHTSQGFRNFNLLGSNSPQPLGVPLLREYYNDTCVG